MAQEHKRQPFAGPLLTLGRQGILATLDEAREILRSEGIEPAALPGDRDWRTNIPSWKGTWNERLASDLGFFGLLGVFDVKALDYSDYEKPDYVGDLNKPVAPEMIGRFSAVIDGGTIEHVFDPRQALTNIGLMLKPGGRAVHLVPVNNYVNHGFYQFSPTFFFDYYKANGYVNLRGYLLEASRYFDSLHVYELPESGYARFPHFVSENPLSCFFVAQKTAASTAGAAPSQGRYDVDYAVPNVLPFQVDDASLKSKIRRALPKTLERFIRRYFLAYDPDNRLPYGIKILLMRVVPGFDKRKEPWERQLKPWGLRLLGRFD